VKSLYSVNSQIDVQFYPSDGNAFATLVLHNQGERAGSVENGAVNWQACIPEAQTDRISAGRPSLYHGDVEAALATIEEFSSPGQCESSCKATSSAFLHGAVHGISSIRRTAPPRWRPRLAQIALDRHDELALQVVEKHRGTLIKSTGDGIWPLSTGRPAASDALSRSNGHKQIGLPIRAGLHTGEIEIRGRDIAASLCMRLRAS